jgi:hypothetical protein
MEILGTRDKTRQKRPLVRSPASADIKTTPRAGKAARRPLGAPEPVDATRSAVRRPIEALGGDP